MNHLKAKIGAAGTVANRIGLRGFVPGILLAVMLLSGTTAEAASASPTTVDFGNVPINTSVTRDVTITADAGYKVEIASGSGINVPFSFSFDTCTGSFPGPGSCNIKETFSPTAVGPSSGTTNIFECPTIGGTCVPIPFDVSGNGIRLAAASPTTVDFGNVPINTSVTRDVTITADAGYKVEIASGSGINLPFSFSFDTCTGSFPGPGSCNIKETFSPTAVGPSSGTTNIFECPTIGGTCVPIPFDVSGNGIRLAAASPTTVDFGNVPINTSVTRDVTISADAGYKVEIASGSGINVPFSFSFDTCTGSFPGPGSCNIKETFSPTAVGPSSGTTNIFECPTIGGTCVPIPFDVSGNGIRLAAASPTTVDFGNVPINTSVTRDVTITADAGYKVEIASGSGINVPFSFSFDTCTGSFPGPGSCNIKETFSPTAVGPSGGTTNIFECPTIGGTCVPIPFDVSGNGISSFSITTTSLPDGHVGITYPRATLAASGGTGPVTWSVTSGSPPAGLTLNPSTGVITGKPTASGLSTFTVSATDSGTPVPQTASKTLSIAVFGTADLAISLSSPEKPLPQPRQVRVVITVQNRGPNMAGGAQVTDELPAGTKFVSATSSQGNCTTPPVGSTGTVSCSLGSLAKGATATIRLVLEITVKKRSIVDSASVATDPYTSDPISTNNTATRQFSLSGED